MIRLVVSDVDGTLVRTDKTLSDANVAAIGRLGKSGVPVTLISARPPSGLYAIIERLDLSGPFAAFNGGVIFDRDHVVLLAHRLDADVARRIFELFVDMGVVRWVYADGGWFVNAINSAHTPREIKSAGIEPTISHNIIDRLSRTDKLVAVSDDNAVLTEIEAAAREIAGDSATIARSQPYFLDVTASAANKGAAVATLADVARVSLSDVAVLGDQNNDLPMFARAGYSVAMGQASHAVRAAADAVSATNDDDGVADAIDRFLMPQIEAAEQSR